MEKARKNSDRKRRLRRKLSARMKEGKKRLTVFRSTKEIYVQLIDDMKGKTIVSFSGKKLESKKKDGKTKTEIAFAVGEEIAALALKKKVKEVVFDRGSYKYHGRVKAVADGARKGGLKF